jgi:hypothetical protein
MLGVCALLPRRLTGPNHDAEVAEEQAAGGGTKRKAAGAATVGLTTVGARV